MELNRFGDLPSFEKLIYDMHTGTNPWNILAEGVAEASKSGRECCSYQGYETPA